MVFRGTNTWENTWIKGTGSINCKKMLELEIKKQNKVLGFHHAEKTLKGFKLGRNKIRFSTYKNYNRSNINNEHICMSPYLRTS